MLAYALGNCPWLGSEQGVSDLFVHIHVHVAVGGDDECVPVLCFSSPEQGRLLELLGAHGIDDGVDSAIAGCAIEELGGKHLHGILPTKWI